MAAVRNIVLPDGSITEVRLPDGRTLHIRVNPGGSGQLAFDSGTTNGQVDLKFTATNGVHAWAT